MKKILLFLLISVMSSAQEFTTENKTDKFQQVVDVKGSSTEIYKQIKLYLNEKSDRTKFVIDVDDPSSGFISYHVRSSRQPVSTYLTAEATYKVTLEIKDGRIRYTVSPINVREDLAGIKIERSLSSFSDLTSEEEVIAKKEQEISSETKPKKIVSLKKELQRLNNDMKPKLEAITYFRESIKSGVTDLVSSINSASDW